MPQDMRSDIPGNCTDGSAVRPPVMYFRLSGLVELDFSFVFSPAAKVGRDQTTISPECAALKVFEVALTLPPEKIFSNE